MSTYDKLFKNSNLSDTLNIDKETIRKLFIYSHIRENLDKLIISDEFSASILKNGTILINNHSTPITSDYFIFKTTSGITFIYDSVENKSLSVGQENNNIDCEKVIKDNYKWIVNELNIYDKIIYIKDFNHDIQPRIYNNILIIDYRDFDDKLANIAKILFNK